MIGPVLNGLAVVIGGSAGAMGRLTPSESTQRAVKVLLGAGTVYVGLSLVWDSIGGSWRRVFWQVGVLLASLTLGRMLGRMLRLQRGLNRLGRYAGARVRSSPAGSSVPGGVGDGLVVGAILFGMAPLGFVGALQDGLAGNIRPLLIKSVMDGLAAQAFGRMFGWGAALSALPVLALEGTLSLVAGLVRAGLGGGLGESAFGAVSGMLVFTVALVVLEIKKVELADYLPGLVVAPLLTRIASF